MRPAVASPFGEDMPIRPREMFGRVASYPKEAKNRIFSRNLAATERVLFRSQAQDNLLQGD